jgi:hypothetical protein
MQLQTINLQPYEFTQDDTALLELVAVDDSGNPIDITLATFSTQILGANGVGPVVFGNSQHTIINGPLGQFALALATGDTANCGLGQHKQILTQLTIGGIIETCRGVNILTVYAPVPLQ